MKRRGLSLEKDYSVFEFNDEAVEQQSIKVMGKYASHHNPKVDDSGVTKYQFLECFSKTNNAPQAGVNDGCCLDFMPTGISEKSGPSVVYQNHELYTVNKLGLNGTCEEASLGLKDILVTSSQDINEAARHTIQGNYESGVFMSRADSLPSEFLGLEVPCKYPNQVKDTPLQAEENLVDVASDGEGSLMKSSVSTSDSNLSGDEGVMEPSTSDHCSSGYCDKGTECSEVAFTSDFVFCGKRHYQDPRLTFFSECIKLEVPFANGNDATLSWKWGLLDIFSIEYNWVESVSATWLRLHLSPTAMTDGESVWDASGGVVKLIFAVNDPNWLEKVHMITFLSDRYKDICNAPYDSDCNSEKINEDDSMGIQAEMGNNPYLTRCNEPFEDLVYPKGDPDAVSIGKRDVELLQPEVFVNDTIIDFYIKYLQCKLEEHDKNRFHFFNSFFFRKLADLDKNPGCAFESKAAFQRVRKWTRKVNMFKKDYIFIPVNFNYHWSLMVICHPGEVVKSEDDNDHKVPCVLHLDSIKGSHKDLKDLVQGYLWEEWKERHAEEKESCENALVNFSNMRFIPLELPQQENSFDCGLFLLHYVELFLRDAPTNFSPFKITKYSNFLTKDWFPPVEAFSKRFHLQKLIYDLHDDHIRTIPPSHSSSDDESTGIGDTEVGDQIIDFVTEECAGANLCLGNSFHSTVEANESSNSNLLISLPVHDGVVGDEACLHDNAGGTICADFLMHDAPCATSPDGQTRPFQDASSPPLLDCALNRLKAYIVDGNEPMEPELALSPTQKPVHIARPETSIACTEDVISGSKESLQIQASPPHNNHFPQPSKSACSASSSSCGSQAVWPPHQHNVDPTTQDHERAATVPAPTSTEDHDCVPLSPVSVSSERARLSVTEASFLEDDNNNHTVAESKESGDSFFSCPDNLPAPPIRDPELPENGGLLPGNIDSGKDLTGNDDCMEITDEVLSEEQMKMTSPKRMKLGLDVGPERQAFTETG
ncbi:hypothetical protein AMTRI_Chr13g91060 [Amborella trichopoda]